MVKFFKIAVVGAACMCLTSCATIIEASSMIVAEYDKYVKNTNDDFLGLHDVAQAWQEGSVGQGLVLTELGVAIADEFTDKDLSVISGVLKNTRNAYTEDAGAGYNDTADLISVALYGGLYTYDHFEEKKWLEKIDEFYNRPEMDPDSPEYDPYFEFRYEIDHEKRQIRRRDPSEVYADIRAYDENLRISKQREDMIKYHVTTEWDFDTYFATEELRSKNAKKYRECCSELAKAYARERQKEKELLANKVQSTEVKALTEVEIKEPNEILCDNEKTVNYADISTTDDIIKQINSIVIDRYALNAYALTADQKTQLETLLVLLKENMSIQVTIVGHTCDIGTDKANASVGIKRAEFAKKYLVGCGIDASRINVYTVGCSEPAVITIDSESRLLNRRITFICNL